MTIKAPRPTESRGNPSQAARGFCVWLTGIPASGKTTLGRLLVEELQKYSLPTVLLDGDELRKTLCRGLGFSKEDRDENVRRVAYVADIVTQCNGIAVVSLISPYHDAREQARQKLGRFVEVFLSCPLEDCMARDTKGLYRRALAGEISNVTGVSDPYEEPLTPEVVVQTHLETPRESLQKIMAYLESCGYLNGARPHRHAR